MPNARTPYEGTALLGDPLHGYIPFTVPYPWNPRERTEKDLLDSPWMQRLRYIYQLQSARWVYPSAEHSRFVHSLGAMWVAGKFARHLYPSLKATLPETPSEACVEELLRLAALLHDIGHGPFGHFFDDNYLEQYGLTHERVGREIILKALGGVIRRIRRSPHAPFAPGEGIDPRWITFLINKTDAEQVPAGMPRWVRFLQPLLGGSTRPTTSTMSCATLTCAGSPSGRWISTG
ncbi:MAG: HD domain-containing protein [Nitrospirae bacterium]|nr:HD domain-containing protein [Nitrospirota bacterium]